MRRKNQNGCIHIIVYLLILVVFGVTVYACLDILNLIEVPDKYSIQKWITDNSKNIEFDLNLGTENVVENVSKKVWIENQANVSNTESPVVGNYMSQEGTNDRDYQSAFSYYEQLDEYGKIIYSELDKNLENMKTGLYNVQFGTTFDDLLHQENGEEVLNNSFQLAINALNFDNPELFYLDISKMYLLTRITTKLWGTKYEVEIGASEGQSYLNDTFASKEEVDEAIRQIEMEKSRIKAALRGSVENQIRGVHDYLVESLEYDSTISKRNIYNIYGALINKETVCEGYARSFKAIMDDLNIPCIIACGTAVNSSDETENHAWNYVRIDNKWYAIDVTWDDPIIIGNGYVIDKFNYRYYLKGSNDFFKNHTENGDIVSDANFKYPTLSYYNY